VGGIEKQLPLFGTVSEQRVSLPVPDPWQELRADYGSLGLSLGRHPLSMLRKQLAARRCRRSREMAPLPHGTSSARTSTRNCSTCCTARGWRTPACSPSSPSRRSPTSPSACAPRSTA